MPGQRKGGNKDVKRMCEPSAAGVRPVSLVIPWVEKGAQREEGKPTPRF